MQEKLLKTKSGQKWQRISLQRRAGVLVPLFSLYSRNSIGIGDFRDLKFLIDWCVETGNSIIQLLPLNELGALLCPYDGLSSFALEPAYLSLSEWPSDEIKALRKKFPLTSSYVDYQIKNAKLELLWRFFLKDNYALNAEFKKFVEKNAYWLTDFALFKVLKAQRQSSPWYEWEDAYKNRDEAALNNFERKHRQEVDFQMWLQWQLYRQLKSVKEYAASKKVLLKGDLPLLVSRDSAEVWQHPEFFKLEFAAGAPPDMYCAKGQRWGMPTYNWERIAADGYRYLQEKLKYAGEFYDILRIDHVVGLFRIWSIPYQQPLENKGLNGFFDPPDEQEWERQGRNILSVMLNNTQMLLCAEDLGMIPKVCTSTLEEFGIPGNDVQRWVKDWKVRHDFLMPHQYRFLSVAMLSTHDTTNWSAWWENEAGTIDETLFQRKCHQRGIDYSHLKDKLFNPEFCRHGRLRWLDSVDSEDKLVAILNTGFSPDRALPKEHLLDLVEMYANSYREKENLWRQLKLTAPLREKSDKTLVREALKFTLQSQAIFCIQLIWDWLALADIYEKEPAQYRLNTPGTISQKNWSLRLPLSLEELLEHKVSQEIRELVFSAGRSAGEVTS